MKTIKPKMQTEKFFKKRFVNIRNLTVKKYNKLSSCELCKADETKSTRQYVGTARRF